MNNKFFWKTAVSQQRFWVMAVLIMLICLAVAEPAHAVTFTVNSTADVKDVNPGDGECADINGQCTLRAAVSETNALPGADVIILPAGIYLLSIPTNNDDNNLNGDLDIRDHLTIQGSGEQNTFVDAGLKFRVFDIPANLGIHVTFQDLTIRNGQTGAAGGGIRNNGNTVLVIRCILRDNLTGEDGGAIQNAIDGNLTVQDSLIINNTADDDGGGIQDFGGTVTISNSQIMFNQAVGGVSNDGGGIYSLGDLFVSNSLIRNNISGRDGGGIYNADGHTVIDTSTISHNTAGDDGGGINNNDNTVLIKNSTINNNLATGSPADGLVEGGGIYAFAIMDVVNSTISGNVAAGGSTESAGGGLFNDGTARIFNSTISGNAVQNSPVLHGGGIHNDGNPDTVMLMNSIITDSEGGDCSNTGLITAFSGTNNLVDDYDSGPCDSVSATAVTGFNDALNYNVGTTQTHDLFPGSNAINAGVNNCPDQLGIALAIDQRGIPRPQEGICDIGAVEFLTVRMIYLPFIVRE